MIVVGPIALKIARNEEGRASNRYEAKLYHKTLGVGTALVQRVVMEQPRPFDVDVAEAALALTEMAASGP